jgi:hypothetical protein
MSNGDEPPFDRCSAPFAAKVRHLGDSAWGEGQQSRD